MVKLPLIFNLNREGDIVQAFSDERKNRADNEKETGRLEAFSDGVFAVAITLLVLDIKLIGVNPGAQLPDDSVVWGSFLHQVPTIAAFIISFFTIGIMWLNHHKIFKQIQRIDTGLLLLNILLLLVIVFIPVPTALLAEYLLVPGQHAAAIIYSGTFFMMAVCFNLLWRYAAHRGRLLGRDVDLQAVEGISRQYLFGPLLYVIPLILAFINTPATAICQFLLALFFALPGRPLPSKPKTVGMKKDVTEGQHEVQQP